MCSNQQMVHTRLLFQTADKGKRKGLGRGILAQNLLEGARFPAHYFLVY